MTPRNIIEEFDRCGMSLAANGDRLLVGGPKGELTDELRNALRSHKVELLALLALLAVPPDPLSEPPPVFTSSDDPSQEWDPETLQLIQWFRSVELPDEPFTLRPGVRVMEPALWRSRIEADISGGPETPRGLTGALLADLRAARKLFHKETRS